MPPQTTVKFSPSQWKAEGQLATSGERHVLGALAPAYNGQPLRVIPFGRAAYLDPKTNKVTRPTAAPAKGTIVIVPILASRFGLQLTDQRRMSAVSASSPLPSNASDEQKQQYQADKKALSISAAKAQDEIQGYPPGPDIQIEYYRTGTVVMWLEDDDAVNMGAPVYFRHVDGDSDRFPPMFAGRVTTKPTTDHTRLENAYFAESKKSKGLVAVLIDNLMIVA